MGQNTMLSETGDESVTESSDVSTLQCGSSHDISMTCFKFVVSVDIDGTIEHERMSLEGGTAEGSVSVGESKIPVELQNGKGWQHCGEPSDYNFYLYQMAFPRT